VNPTRTLPCTQSARNVKEPATHTVVVLRASLGSLIAPVVVLLLLALAPSGLQGQANIINTIAGGGPTPTDPLQADIPGPTGIIRNSAGDLYIAPPFASYIYKLSAGGAFSVYSGKGYGGFDGDGGPVGSAKLGYPSGFAYDNKGNLYITDFGNSRVRKVDAVTGIITTVVGTGEKCAHPTNTCGDGGLATAALLNLPEAIAIDSTNNIFIADSSDNRIRKVDAGTGIITTVVGTGNACSNPTLPCGDAGLATAANLNFPQGVTVDGSGNIYVSDTLDNRVRRVTASTGIIARYAGNGGACIDPTKKCGDGLLAVNANLHAPQGVALDTAGNGYIADSRDHRVRKVDTSGNISTFAGTGTQGFSGDGGQATLATLDLPGFVYPDSSGNFDIADTGNQRIRQVNAAGTIQTLAGGGSGGDTGPALQATLAGPYTLTEDSSGKVYFTDLYNNRVRRIANDSQRTITTVAGTGSAGSSGDGGPGTSATLNGPSSVVLDAVGNLYIADENNLVVRKLTPAGVITKIAGTGKSCTPTTAVCGDGGPALSATFASPQTLALDASGNIYIADYFAHRIRKIDASTQKISTFAGTGNAGNSGDGGVATSANLNHPSGITLDSAGNLYISDQYNYRIRVVKTDHNIYEFALNSQAHLAGDGGPAINGSMWNPLEITIDPAGNLYVSGGNDRVVQIIDAATQYWGTVAGSSKKATSGDFSGDGGPAQSARLANAGSSVDAAGKLYIGDEGNNRIRYVLLAPGISNTPASLAFGNVPLNQTSAPQTVNTLSSGGLDLNLTSVSITGTNANEFAISSNTCPAVPVAPNRKCAVSVTFTPTNYGKQTATLSFADNATGSPQSVSLSGSGPDFTISASPTSLTINKGSSGSSTVTLAPLAQFSQPITMSQTGCPLNTNCSITPGTVTMDGIHNGIATLNITTMSTTPSGTYSIVVRGAFTPLQHPVTITLTVP
jgi:trimeric autotransporter adhesin